VGLTGSIFAARPDAPSGGTRATLSLLGGFRIGAHVGPDGLPLPAQRLVACLAVQRGRGTRDFLAESLWPRRTRDLARLNLRQAAYQERRAAHHLISASRAELWLSPSVTVDLDLVGAGLRRLLAPGADAAVDLEDSDLVDDLLPTWDEPWLGAERERFRELRLRGLEVLSERSLGQGDWARAIGAALAVIEADPLRESARALLIRAHLGQHNLASAFRVLDAYRELLRRELRLEPSPELTHLLVAPAHLGRPITPR
jgi:DNA-binding SARP family transcriptional activator